MQDSDDAVDPLAPARHAARIFAIWVTDSPAFIGAGVVLVLGALTGLATASFDRDLALAVLREMGPTQLLASGILSALPLVALNLFVVLLMLASRPGVRRFTYAVLAVHAALGVLLTTEIWVVAFATPVLALGWWVGHRTPSSDDADLDPNWILFPLMLAVVFAWQVVAAPVAPLERLRFDDGRVQVGRVLREGEHSLKLLTGGELLTIRAEHIRSRRICGQPWYFSSLPELHGSPAHQPCH